MPTDLTDVSETYLKLVREHLHRFREALAVYFLDWVPGLALVELPDVGCVPVCRRQVTDLLEFARTDVVEADERQLEFEWSASVRLEDPMIARVGIMIPKRLLLWRVVA